MTIAILNPGSGNITSIRDALERLERPCRVLEEPDLDGIRQIILPGQGRFGAVMERLAERCWIQPLRDWVEQGKPLLGICVGMQILFESSEEDPGVAGLGILKGKVTRLRAEKLPMIGWASVRWSQADYRESSAYFANSYVVERHAHQIGETENGQKFCSVVRRGALWACQFHPEKSGISGKEFLQRCLVS